MSESNRKTFVIKSSVPDVKTPSAPVAESTDQPRKLFQIKSIAPQYELPTKRHGLVNTTESLVADLHPHASREFRLYFTQQSFHQVEHHIGWGQRTDDNGVEQGGLLLGNAYIDSEENLVFAIVRNAIAGLKARGSGAYLDMTHETWAEMLAQVDAITDADPDSSLQIVGWYHTHPNTLDVFMSGTDKNTQRTFFRAEWQFAVVLNPHKKLWRVYHGSESAQCEGFVIQAEPRPNRTDAVSEVQTSPTAEPVRTSAVEESAVWANRELAGRRRPRGVTRVLRTTLLVYSLVVTAAALFFGLRANRLERRKRLHDREAHASASPSRNSLVDLSRPAQIRHLFSEWRVESLRRSEYDQRIIAEAEAILIDMVTKQQSDVPQATPTPKIGWSPHPEPIEESASNLLPVDSVLPVPASTTVPTPPYGD